MQLKISMQQDKVAMVGNGLPKTKGIATSATMSPHVNPEQTIKTNHSCSKNMAIALSMSFAKPYNLCSLT